MSWDEHDDGHGEWLDVDKITHPGLRKFLGLLEKVKGRSSDKPELRGQWEACCPAHDDNSPSLSIGWWKNDRVSVRCFAECSRDEIIRAVEMTSDELAPPRPGKARVVARYPYEDENGELLYQYQRFEPKKIRPRRPNGKGGWIYNLGNVRRVLYRLPQLISAVAAGETIFVCEGEKDVDRLRSLGLAATCNPGGAAKWRPAYSEFLQGADVVLLQDNDSAGESHVKVIAAAVSGIAKSVRVVCFVDLPPKSDVSDWLDLGHTANELHQVVANTPVLASNLPVVPTKWTEVDPDREHLMADAQGIWMLTHEGKKRLTNFRAQIVADVVEDDGAESRRVFEITAAMGEQVITFRILAKDFFEMKWHLEHIGASAAVMPNTRSGVARYAIQVMSSPIPRRTVYMHTGWREVRDGEFVFLHGGGAIGSNAVVEGIEVRLEAGLGAFVLPTPPTRDAAREAVQESLRLLEGLAPDRIMFPLLAAVWRAPLGAADFGLHLAGRTGSRKTALAAVAQQHFGSGLDARHLPANWSSTANALEGTAFLAKDVLLTVDDFCPKGSKNDVDALQKLAERLFRAQGNSSGRARMRQDATLRPVKPPRGLILSTGEDVPVGQSLAARVLMLELGPKDVDLARLTEAQDLADDGRLAECMSGYVRYLASRIQSIKASLSADIRRIRAKAILAGAHPRTPSIIANLMLGVMRFVEYACSIGVFDTSAGVAFEQRAWAALMEAGNLQAVYQADDSPASVYIRGVTAALASCAAHLTDSGGGLPANPSQCGWVVQQTENDERWQPRGPRIGFIEGDDLYLLQEPSYRAAQQMTEGSANRLALGLSRLRRTLWEEGHLKSKGERGDKVYFQARRQLEGQRLYVLHFAPGDFGLEVSGDRARRDSDEM